MSAVARRLVTVPLYVALTALLWGTLPLTAAAAALADLARARRRFGALRSLLFFAVYLACETAGLAAAGALWLARRIGPASARERDAERHFRLQCWWARSLLGAARRIFRMPLEVEGADEVGPGPLLLFVRHASTGDTVLPAALLSDRRGLRLRYVIKRELLWDPCLDIVGHRLPNVFVRRGSDDSAREIEAVRRLADGLGRGEGILIYPEGTRFSEAKRERVLTRIERRGDAKRTAQAHALRCVLPPRLGGPMALLEAAPGADAVFCAHVGFDAATRFSEFLAGGLVGSPIRVAFWRIPAAEIPTEDDARADWMFAQWARVDAWVAAHRKPTD